MQLHIAITGASGTTYAARLIDKLAENPQVSLIYLTLTDTAKKVAAYEIDQQWLDGLPLTSKVKVLDNHDYFVSVASGSAAPDCMVVVPCSMGMASRIAAGISNDLISRAADVMIKENRPLIIVPRETPLSLIHLQNLTRLKSAGVTILPAAPSFYSKPASLGQLIDTVIERIIDHTGLSQKKTAWKQT